MFDSIIKNREVEVSKLMRGMGLPTGMPGMGTAIKPDRRKKVRSLHKHRSNAQVRKKRKRALTKKSQRRNRR